MYSISDTIAEVFGFVILTIVLVIAALVYFTLIPIFGLIVSAVILKDKVLHGFQFKKPIR